MVPGTGSHQTASAPGSTPTAGSAVRGMLLEPLDGPGYNRVSEGRTEGGTMWSGATSMLRLTAVATVMLAGCTSGGHDESGSGAGISPPSAWSSPGSPASLEPSPAASAPIDVSSLTGRIAFSNVTEDIWVINADGSGLHQLTSNPAHDFDPAWSPDGRKLAFRSERDGNNEIY